MQDKLYYQEGKSIERARKLKDAFADKIGEEGNLQFDKLFAFTDHIEEVNTRADIAKIVQTSSIADQDKQSISFLVSTKTPIPPLVLPEIEKLVSAVDLMREIAASFLAPVMDDMVQELRDFTEETGLDGKYGQEILKGYKTANKFAVNTQLEDIPDDYYAEQIIKSYVNKLIDKLPELSKLSPEAKMVMFDSNERFSQTAASVMRDKKNVYVTYASPKEKISLSPEQKIRTQSEQILSSHKNHVKNILSTHIKQLTGMTTVAAKGHIEYMFDKILEEKNIKLLGKDACNDIIREVINEQNLDKNSQQNFYDACFRITQDEKAKPQYREMAGAIINNDVTISPSEHSRQALMNLQTAMNNHTWKLSRFSQLKEPTHVTQMKQIITSAFNNENNGILVNFESALIDILKSHQHAIENKPASRSKDTIKFYDDIFKHLDIDAEKTLKTFDNLVQHNEIKKILDKPENKTLNAEKKLGIVMENIMNKGTDTNAISKTLKEFMSYKTQTVSSEQAQTQNINTSLNMKSP